jgi:hypothetical protein
MRFSLWLAAGMLLTAAPAWAYQFDYGTPEIPSPLNAKRGQMYMRMSHRYNAAAFPADSAPSLNLGLGLTKQITMDLIASTRNRPLDAELGLRYQLLDEYDGTPFALTTRLGYTSHIGGSAIGEVVASKNNLLPGLGVGLIGRYFSYVGDYSANPGWMTAGGLGLSYSLAEGMNLVGDIVAPLDQSVIDANGFNWSTGLQWWIPDTPHVLLLMVGRMGPGTTYGRTFSPGRDTMRVGFEYHAHFDAPFFPRRTISIDLGEDEE